MNLHRVIRSADFGIGLGLALCLWPGLPARGHGGEEVVILRPVADAALFETGDNNNLGGTVNLPVGTMNSGRLSRALLRFDLASAIPTNSIVDSAELVIKVSTVGSASVTSTVRLHNLLKSWGEGNKSGNQGATATAGEVTWNARFHPDQLWSRPGAVTNLDYVAVPSSEVTLGDINSYTFPSTPDLVTDVQNWVLDPARNFGWIMISAAEGVTQNSRRFYSREDPTNAPLLKVTYRVIEADHPLEKFEILAGHFLLHLNLAANQHYQVQAADALGGPAATWRVLNDFPPSTSVRHFVFADPLGANAMRFYRIAVSNSVTASLSH